MEQYTHTEGLYNTIWQATRESTVPLSCDIELTARCNQKCLFCFRDTVPQHSDKIPIHKYKELLDELKQLGVFSLHITGGEPFLYQGISEFLDYASCKGFNITLTTNGTMGNGRELASFLGRNHIYTRVSLHGHNSEIHDSLTGLAGAFDRTVEFIKSLVSAGAFVAVNTTLCKANIAYVQEMYDFTKALGVNKFGPGLSLLGKIGDSGANDSLRFTETEAMSAALTLKKLGLAPKKKETPYLLCNAGKNSFTISSEGDILFCNLMRRVCGNIYNASIADIWKDSAEWRELRQLKMEDLVNCTSCPHEPYCRRCPAEIYEHTGNFIGNTSAVCDIAKIWHQVDMASGGK